MLYRDSGAPFLQAVVLLSVLFVKSKIPRGQSFMEEGLQNFIQQGKQYCREINFRKVQTKIFEKLASSYMFTISFISGGAG